MKRILLIFVLGASMLLLDKAIGQPVEAQMPTVSEEECVSDTVTRTEWDIFVQALIYVESEGKPNAVGKTNDVGILQITPIYVREVNRILGEERFTLEDRVDVDKSLEMFTVL